MKLTLANLARGFKVAPLTLKHSNLPERYIKRLVEDVQYKAPKLPQYRQITVKKIKRCYDIARPWEIKFQIDYYFKRKKPAFVEPIKEWSVFQGDRVEILTGRDKGKQGTVCEVIQERNWVFVEGLNTFITRTGATKKFEGFIRKIEAPLLVTTDVSLVDPEDLKPTKIEWRYTEGGEKVRVSLRTGRIIPIPPMEESTYDYKTKNTYKENPEKDTNNKELSKITFVPSLQTFEMCLMDEFGIKEDRIPAKTYWY